ncbi:Gfo/Idh/MocA family protein [Aureibacillus halotolerans]|uniref:Putative dehydrogenase n=1 Tax=Aureibacillus halotolerans TaxID=1508390 RepID=A0A4V3D512_9BACI|nr:Gfo/Idh/MocA family oxidoreductase [Aureibacillus halotolerans]TDQ38317.1 putative dehydrogenase [Aureibacillus halotolerans]
MDEKVSIVLVGSSGYGAFYATQLIKHFESAYIKAVVDVAPEKSAYYQHFIDTNTPIYSSLEAFYKESEADAAIISSPIQFHRQQSIYALEHGSHVLCEKPATGNPEDLAAMAEARDRTGKHLLIGFNWSFSPDVQKLKNDIQNGLFGKPKRGKALVLWPRNLDYYGRSSWAGKAYGPNGEMIFDSVANNATSHFLHHLFYLLGAETNTSAVLNDVTAELYRANPIETFDTCAVRIQTKDDIELLYIASHAVKNQHNPYFEIEFENATLTREADEEGKHFIQVHWNDGQTTQYVDPENDHSPKIALLIDLVNGKRSDEICGIEAASSHVNCIRAMHESVPVIPNFPEDVTAFDEEKKLNWVPGLEETLKECYTKGVLPHELGVSWAKVGVCKTLG